MERIKAFGRGCACLFKQWVVLVEEPKKLKKQFISGYPKWYSRLLVELIGYPIW